MVIHQLFSYTFLILRIMCILQLMNESELVKFLRDLADSLEKKELSNNKIKLISELYISYNFEEELDRQNTSNTKKDFEEEDLVKFISLGYYVYTHLIEK